VLFSCAQKKKKLFYHDVAIQVPEAKKAVDLSSFSSVNLDEIEKTTLTPENTTLSDFEDDSLAPHRNRKHKIEEFKKVWGDVSVESFTETSLELLIDYVLSKHVNTEQNISFAQYSMFKALLNNSSKPQTILVPQANEECLNEVNQDFCIVDLKLYNEKNKKKNEDLDLENQVLLSRKIQRERYEHFSSLDHEDLRLKLQGYVDSIEDPDFLFPAAPYDYLLQLHGFLNGLDPHSSVLSANFLKMMTGTGDQELFGVGALLRIVNDRLFIVKLYDGPAKEAGLLVFDEITAVNGVDLHSISESLDLSVIVEKIKGELGTQVDLKILRRGDEELNFEISRGKITVKNVEFREEDSAYVLKFESFTELTDEEIAVIAQENFTKNPKKPVVIDLRDNPGGSVDTVNRITDNFLGKIGETIFYALSKNFFSGLGEFSNFRRSRYRDDAVKNPLITLINSGSASASEILAANLKHAGRSLVIGERTYGKGTMQSVPRLAVPYFPITLDFNIKFTTGMYFAHSNFTPQNIGVEPDLIIGKYSHQDTLATNYESNYPHALKQIDGEQPFVYELSDEMKKAKLCSVSLAEPLMSSMPNKLEDIDSEFKDHQMDLALQTAANCY